MAHGATRRTGLGKFLQMLSMSVSESMRNKTFKWLTQCLRRAAAEHGLSSQVKHQDVLLSIGCNNGIPGGVEDARHFCLVVKQSLFCTFACRQTPAQEDIQQKTADHNEKPAFDRLKYCCVRSPEGHVEQELA